MVVGAMLVDEAAAFAAFGNRATAAIKPPTAKIRVALITRPHTCGRIPRMRVPTTARNLKQIDTIWGDKIATLHRK